MENIKINQLEVENVKRIRAVKVEPTKNGLTVIGGRNNQGKTSVLDAIAWGLGGDAYRPSMPQHEGSVIPPFLHIVLSNGLIVERKGKNSDLKVIDPDGNKGGQQLLNSFVEQLALDLPRFMESSSREKARTLLGIIGVGEQLAALEQQEKEKYNERLTIGQIADRKKKFADEQTYYPDAPREPVSPSDLIREQQEILARNGENQKKRENEAQIRKQVAELCGKVQSLEYELDLYRKRLKDAESDLDTAVMSVKDLQDRSTAELEASIANIEEINRKVRTNLDKDKAEEDALEYKRQYDELTAQIEEIRKSKIELLQTAELPLTDLSVEDGELLYKGQKWDNMSGSDRLKVSTAIVRKLNPKCGFVLLDKLEQMDLEGLQEFGEWLEKEGLQAIATRVSTGGECSIIIEDGYISGEVPAEEQPTWKAGAF